MDSKISMVSKDIRKTVQLYVIGIVAVYVAVTIMASQKIIDLGTTTPNEILLGGGIVVGVFIIVYNVYAVKQYRKLKKLKSE